MRVLLFVILLALIAGGIGFFYLVNQAEAAAPAPHQAEVSVDVDLSS